MIIVGYQGIGKSSLARKVNSFIDLESGNFWVDGKRDEHWAQVYANMAIHLSSQGFNVFTSSHKVLRDLLHAHPAVDYPRVTAGEVVIVCYPALELREPWTKKLEERYKATKLDKDFKAWRNAVEMYDENIHDLMDERPPFLHTVLTSMDYNLEKELGRWIKDLKGSETD